jgi:hypothetical protein
MNQCRVSEGVRRIKVVAKTVWIVGLGCVLVAIACGMMVLGGTLPQNSPLSSLLLVVGLFGVYLFLCGFLVRVGIWVLEGFLLGRTPPE